MAGLLSLRRWWMDRQLGRTEEGRWVRALLTAAISQDMFADDYLGSPVVKSVLRDAIASRFRGQGDIARRIGALFAAGHERASDFLAETAYSAVPQSPLFVSILFDRMIAQGREKEMEALASVAIGDEASDVAVVEAVLTALGRAGYRDDHPLVAQCCSRLAGAGREAAGGARAYRALELPYVAQTVKRGTGNHRSFDAALIDVRRSDPFAALFDRLNRGSSGYEPDDRLLLFGNSLACGGMERVFAQSYRSFAESGEFAAVDMALLEFAPNTPSAHYLGEAGIDASAIIPIRQRSPADEIRALVPSAIAARTQALCDYVSEHRPRVIHAWNDITGLIAASAGLLLGCPRIVIHFHHTPAMPLGGTSSLTPHYPDAYRRLLQRPEIRTVFCADMAARDYARWWCLPQTDRFRVLRNGLHWDRQPGKADARARLGLSLDANVIGAVTRFDPVKQMHLWAEAAIAYAARDPDACFLIVGDGPEREAVTDQFRDAGLIDRAHFVGRQEQVADYYAAMDAFWMTSSSEGLPLVSIEAAHAGVPVIAFDVGGIRETLDDGHSGILVSSGDTIALVAETFALLGDARRHAAMSEAASRFAAAEFSFDRYRGELLKLYA